MKVLGFHMLVFLLAGAGSARAENGWKERSFSQPVAVVRAALKELDGVTSGHLPILEGFVVASRSELDRYQRPYYQLVVRIASSAQGGSLVRVAAKITAWNPAGHAGYRALPSNGRLESDLFDRLEQALGEARQTAVPTASSLAKTDSSSAEISTPVPQIPRHTALAVLSPAPENPGLEREAQSLEEVLRNQSHPDNLVAVKRDLTPVLQSPRSDAQVLFLASAEDEFEVLDQNSDWVHVRISGVARGWLEVSMVEMPGAAKDPGSEPTAAASTPSSEERAETDRAMAPVFSITGDELGSFPGDWAPLKGKSVRIISLRARPSDGRITTAEERRRFAESALKNQSLSPESIAGVVLIFDAADGGMLAVPGAALERWKAGVLSDQGFWRECYLDPPEILGAR